MTYQLTAYDSIKAIFKNGSTLFLPIEDNGTPEWAAYKAWLDEGNTPLPAPDPAPPAPLTPAEKLAAAGLTVEELKALLTS